MHSLFALSALVLLAAVFPFPAFAQTTWAVDPGGGGDFLAIQDCIDAADAGDTCLVGPGTYPENLDFLGKDIAVRSPGGPAATIVNGRRLGSVVVFRGGETAAAVLDGFTLTWGSGTPYCLFHECFEAGGGVYCENASPTITNCTIRGNSADLGGGIGCVGHDDRLTVANSRIQANTAQAGGGALAINGASLDAAGCFIHGNLAAGDLAMGGGVWVSYGSVRVTNCTISGNTAAGGAPSTGGGVGSYGNGLRITNSILWGNAAEQGPQIHSALQLEPAYVTLKYDPAGTPLWTARHGGPADRGNRAGSVCTDPSGNVYVTGSSEGEGTASDYATVKYDPDGNLLWEARYDGPGSGADSAGSVAVDAAGNVLVAGLSSDPSEPLRVHATVKYDAGGHELWAARSSFPGPYGGYYVYPSADGVTLAVDGAGNVYVGGTSYGDGTGDDYATVKYDLDGNELWAARYSGPGGGRDEVKALAVDAAGSVFVTGCSDGGGTGLDYATVKYDTDGNLLWAARYDGPAGGIDMAYGLAVDAAGCAVVTGRSAGGGSGADFGTVKYDTDGNLLWAARYDGPGSGADMAFACSLDAAGNVYVTGPSRGSASDYDYATVKYGPDGSEVWAARYDGPAGGADVADSLAVDAAGNVHVTGSSQAAGGTTDYATVTYGPDGDEVWAARYDGPDGDDDAAVSLWVDGAGNVHVTGSSERYPTTPVARYCDVQGGWAGEGNIDQDPLLVAAWGHRLTAASPCIDAGLDTAPGMPATDLDGNPRVTDGDGDSVAVVDMGAHEFQPAAGWGAASTMAEGRRPAGGEGVSRAIGFLFALGLPLGALLLVRGRRGPGG